MSEQEKAELQEIASKGTHGASKVINALMLLDCDQSGKRTERPRTSDFGLRTSNFAAMLCVSARKVNRLKKKFVIEGLDLSLNWTGRCLCRRLLRAIPMPSASRWLWTT